MLLYTPCSLLTVFSDSPPNTDAVLGIMCTCRFKLQYTVYWRVRVWIICACLCVRRVCASAGCLSRQHRPKVVFQLRFMTSGSELTVSSRKNISLSATSLLLYCCRGDIQAPLPQQHCQALWQDAAVLSVAGRGLLQCDVKMQTWIFSLAGSRVGAWNDRRFAGWECKAKCCTTHLKTTPFKSMAEYIFQMVDSKMCNIWQENTFLTFKTRLCDSLTVYSSNLELFFHKVG